MVPSNAAPSLDDRIDPSAHPVWAHTFTHETRAEQLADDVFAGRSVVNLLVALISVGVTLMVVTLTIVLWQTAW